MRLTNLGGITTMRREVRDGPLLGSGNSCVVERGRVAAAASRARPLKAVEKVGSSGMLPVLGPSPSLEPTTVVKTPKSCNV